ncbi:MAG: hypothetical protein AAF125_23990 [Chloroflexota bacterium]
MDLNIFGESTLQRGLNFTEDDLLANRAGFVSDRQKRYYTTSYTVILIVFVAIGVSFGLWFPFGLIWQEMTASWAAWYERGLMGLILLLMIGIVVGLPAAGIWIWHRYTRDVRRGDVLRAYGVARRARDASDTGAYFYVTIGGQQFMLHYGGWRAFEDGKLYTVYYMPRSRQIVSAEFGNAPDDDYLL